MPRIRNWKDLSFYRPRQASRVRARRRPVRRERSLDVDFTPLRGDGAPPDGYDHPHRGGPR
ncbi:hypothetical protein HRW08_00065 [Streptomyces lunaelactis]|nr:hypothetical protein [Streptomyces lunaelactis]